MWAVFLILFIGVTLQNMPVGSTRSVGFQVGYGMAPAIGRTIAVWVLILLIACVYYIIPRENGISFRQAVFNWPLVILVGLVAFLSLI